MHKKLWNKDFLLLLQANAVSTIGDLMYSVAIGYWVYEMTGSNSLMGLMSSISIFVTMFFSPFCGSIVDKCSRKRLIVVIDIMQGLLMLTVGILAYANTLNVPIVLLTALLAAFGSVFYSPAINTTMIDVIPRSEIVRGQSIHSGTVSMINMVGSAFSGAMVAFFGVPLIVVINGISNLYAAFSEMFIRIPPTVQQGTPVTVKSILRDSVTAAKTILSNPALALFVPCALILNLLSAGPLSLMLPFCAEKGFSVDVYGYMMFIYTAASLAGLLLLGTVKLKPNARFWMLALGFTSSVVFYTLCYLSTKLVPILVFAFLAGFSNSLGNTVFNASLMLALPEENRSAILGFIQSASVGGFALSSVIYGLLGDVFPLYLVFTAGSLLSLAPMLYMCFHPKTKAFIQEHCE